MDGGVVKFHALTDTDGAGAQHHDFLLFRQAGGIFSGVGGIEVRNIGAGVAGVHHPVHREHLLFLTQVVNLQLLPAPELCDEFVAEAHGLGLFQYFHASHIGGEPPLHGNNPVHRFQEISGNLGDFVELSNGHIPAQQLGDGEDIVILELFDIVQQLLGGEAVKLGQMEVTGADFQGTDRLQQTLLQVGADAHNLTGGLHLGAQGVLGGGKLVEGESGELCHHIIQRGLKSGGGVGNLDILQSHTHCNLGGHPGDGIAAGLGSQCRGTGHSGVDLNEVILAAVGVQGKLHIAAAFNLQLPDNLDGAVVKHLQVVVVEGHDGGYHNGVTGVNTHRVDVLHAADGDGMVIGVTHDLKLDFLIALDALFNQHLVHRRQLEGVHSDFNQLFFVVGKAAAGAAQSKGRTQNHRITNPQCSGLGLLQIVSNLRGDGGLSDRLAQLLEQLPILCPLNGCAAGAQKLHAALLQNALLLQLHS